MSAAIEIVGFGVVVPAAVSLALCWLCHKCLPSAAAERYAAAVAVAVAFCVGYALLPSWAALHPERHWQWLPYLGAGAMILGPVGLAPGVLKPERWLLHALLAIVTAWLLVPGWSSLQPARPVWILLLTGYLWCLMSALDALPDRLLGRLFLVHLTLISLVVAMLLAAAVSLKYGQLAVIATAAIAGCCVCHRLGARPIPSRGLIPVFVILIGGLAFIGCIEPQPPLIGTLLAPAALSILWLFARGPLARLDGVRAVAVQTAAVLFPLTIALIWVLMGN